MPSASTDQVTELRRARERFLVAWSNVIATVTVAVEATRCLVHELDTQAALVELAAMAGEQPRGLLHRMALLEAEVARLRAEQEQVTRPMVRPAPTSPPGR